MPRRKLEAALRRDHRDEDAWTVYADLLAATGDIRGELIQLDQLASRTQDKHDAVRYRDEARKLFGRRRLDLLGPLGGARMDLEWIRGFVIEAIIHARHEWITTNLLARDIGVLLFWLTYTNLDQCDGIADAIAGSWIETVELRRPKYSLPKYIDIGPLARVPGLRELILQNAWVDGLEQLGELEGFERLLLRDSHVSFTSLAGGFAALRHLERTTRQSFSDPLDIRLLMHLAKLEVLKLPHARILNLEALVELRELREVDLSFTGIDRLDPLFELPKLERVALGELSASLAPAIEQLRERGVEVNTHGHR